MSRYVLDPSACVERFTHTPSRHDTDDLAGTVRIDGDQPDAAESGPGGAVNGQVDHTAPADPPELVDRAESAVNDGSGPCTNSWDTVDATVSQSVGHRELGHNNKEEVVVLGEQHRAREGPPADPATAGRLVDAGVTPTTGCPAGRPTSPAPHRRGARRRHRPTTSTTRPAGSPQPLTATGTSTTSPAEPATRAVTADATPPDGLTTGADDAAARHARTQHRRSRGWADLAADLLDDDQLARLIDTSTTRDSPGPPARCGLTTAQVTGWEPCDAHRRGGEGRRRRPGGRGVAVSTPDAFRNAATTSAALGVRRTRSCTSSRSHVVPGWTARRPAPPPAVSPTRHSSATAP